MSALTDRLRDRRRGAPQVVPVTAPRIAAHAELRARRDALAEEVAELTWDLGGLTYEMAIRDHFRLDVLLRRAAELQQADGELGPAAFERAPCGRERRRRPARADAVGQAHLNVTSPDPPPAGLLSLGAGLPEVPTSLGSFWDFFW